MKVSKGRGNLNQITIKLVIGAFRICEHSANTQIFRVAQVVETVRIVRLPARNALACEAGGESRSHWIISQNSASDALT